MSWRAIFLINLPVAAVMLALAPVLLSESRDRVTSRNLDATGALTITGALALLVVAFVRVPDLGWWSLSTLSTLLVAAGLAAAFVAAERRSTAPLVPLAIFGSRTLVAGNLLMLMAAMTAVGMSLILSLYAQDVLGYSPLKFGLATTAMTAMTLVGSFAAQALVGRLGLWPIAAASMVCLAAGSLALTQVSPDGSYIGDLLPGLLLFGPGLGAGTVVGSIAALAGIAEETAGLASGTNTAAFQIGGAIGAAIVTTVAATQGDASAALTDGYRAAFAACVGFALVGLLATVLLKTRHAAGVSAALRNSASSRKSRPARRPRDRQRQPSEPGGQSAMLSHHPIDVILEVSALGGARAFYERLGLEIVRNASDGGAIEFAAGTDSRLVIKDTPNRGDAERTSASWRVDDLPAVVRNLRERGIEPLEYDIPGVKTVDGIADLGFADLAWTADPSNNVIGLAQYR